MFWDHGHTKPFGLSTWYYPVQPGYLVLQIFRSINSFWVSIPQMCRFSLSNFCLWWTRLISFWYDLPRPYIANDCQMPNIATSGSNEMSPIFPGCQGRKMPPRLYKKWAIKQELENEPRTTDMFLESVRWSGIFCCTFKNVISIDGTSVFKWSIWCTKTKRMKYKRANMVNMIPSSCPILIPWLSRKDFKIFNWQRRLRLLTFRYLFEKNLKNHPFLIAVEIRSDFSKHTRELPVALKVSFSWPLDSDPQTFWGRST